jgi:hypothetical protein
MKRLLYIATAIVAATISISAVAEKVKPVKPDMAQIQREVNDPKSKYYYPKLMKQFEKRDTAMTLDQFRHLYLGYVYQEDYNPYRRNRYSDKAEELYMRDKHTAAEADTIIHYAELSLKDDPFDLRQMSFLIYAYQEKKKYNLAKIWQYKLNHLLEAIISTGTGLDEENAWIVINPTHEYNLINFQNHVVESQEDCPPYYDYIKIKDTDSKSPAGFYFDVRYILEQYNKKFPEQ